MTSTKIKSTINYKIFVGMKINKHNKLVLTDKVYHYNLSEGVFTRLVTVPYLLKPF